MFTYNSLLLIQVFHRFSSNIENCMLLKNKTKKELTKILTPCWAPHGTRRKMTEYLVLALQEKHLVKHLVLTGTT